MNFFICLMVPLIYLWKVHIPAVLGNDVFVHFSSLKVLRKYIFTSLWEGETLLAAHVQRGGARIEADESVKIYNATRDQDQMQGLS